MAGDREPTELERAVARAIALELTIGTRPSPELDRIYAATRAAIAEVFPWRPIETAELWMTNFHAPEIGEYVVRVLTDTDGTVLLLWWDQDAHRWSHWCEISPPSPPQNEP